jgi:hypothetical protein
MSKWCIKVIYVLTEAAACPGMGRKEESASASTRVFQAAGDEEENDKRSVDTLVCDVVSRLRQWEDVRKRRGGEAEVVGSKFGLSQIPPAGHLPKLFLPC